MLWSWLEVGQVAGTGGRVQHACACTHKEVGLACGSKLLPRSCPNNKGAAMGMQGVNQNVDGRQCVLSLLGDAPTKVGPCQDHAASASKCSSVDDST